MSILTNFGKNTNFKFANFKIKIEPNVDSFSLILKKTFPPMIFCEKKSDLHYFYLQTVNFVQKSEIFQKLPMHITPEPNVLETWNLCQNVYFWILYCIPLITQFPPKVDLGPFGNELFIYWNTPTHPDSSDWLRRSHIVQYCCGFCKLEQLRGYAVWVCNSYSNRSYPTKQYLQSILTTPLQLLQLVLATA